MLLLSLDCLLCWQHQQLETFDIHVASLYMNLHLRTIRCSHSTFRRQQHYLFSVRHPFSTLETLNRANNQSLNVFERVHHGLSFVVIVTWTSMCTALLTLT